MPSLLDRRKVNAIYRTLASHIDPKPELHFSNHLELLVAVVLSAQTTDKAVNAVTPELFRRCRTPGDYLALGEEGIAGLTRSIGLYRNKARSIVGLCRQLLERHDGQVPGDLASLLALPGVGVKTANVVLNVGFGLPVIAVDTHIFRVAGRTGLAVEATPEATGETLMAVTPRSYLKNAHHYLLLHGRYTCTARKPHCAGCPIAAWCMKRGVEATEA